jgi:hypothetical protein
VSSGEGSDLSPEHLDEYDGCLEKEERDGEMSHHYRDAENKLQRFTNGERYATISEKSSPSDAISAPERAAKNDEETTDAEKERKRQSENNHGKISRDAREYNSHCSEQENDTRHEFCRNNGGALGSISPEARTLSPTRADGTEREQCYEASGQKTNQNNDDVPTAFHISLHHPRRITVLKQNRNRQ